MVEKISQSNYRLTSVGLIMPELNGVEEEYVLQGMDGGQDINSLFLSTSASTLPSTAAVHNSP